MLTLERNTANFLMGISSPLQLEEWLTSNMNVRGIACVGRSNVGKSTLINSLFGHKTARTSKTPGRTREINIFEFFISENNRRSETLPKFYLFDLPGYGHADVSKEMAKNWNQLMGVFFSKLPPGVIIVNLQDARHPNTEADKQFADFMKNYPQNTTLVFNKLDKLKTQKERNVLEKEKIALLKFYKWVKFIHFVSAESKFGIPQLESTMVSSLTLGLTPEVKPTEGV